MKLKLNLVLLLSAALAMDMAHTPEHNLTETPANFTPVAHKMAHHHGMPILMTDLQPEERAYWEAYNTTTFFTIPSNKVALAGHIGLLTLSVIFLYPICLVLNNVGSKWYLPYLTMNYLILGSSLFTLALFAALVPDMYPKNAYVPMSVILAVVLLVHYVSAFVYNGAKYLTREEEDDYIPLKLYTHVRGTSLNLLPSLTVYDFAEAQRNKSLIESPRMSNAVSESTLGPIEESEGPAPYLDEENLLDLTKTHVLLNSLSRDLMFAKYYRKPIFQKVIKKFGRISGIIFGLLNYTIFGYLMVYACTGLAVGNMMGQGNKVFNLLAHFIKGGVFFILGMVSLARYCGCMEDLGFAWNTVKLKADQKRAHKSIFVRRSPMKGMVTMEFIESFLIFFYGLTNVFLEHLANPGGEWAAKDLQHASIAFIYIGLGLCGLLTEFGLSEWRFRKVTEYVDNNRHPAKQIQYATPGFSPNPFPAFTIFWTGILMSQHAQASETSTKIHTQWGYMLAYGAIVRGITYFLLMLTKETTKGTRGSSVHKPGKPFTELVVSACLFSGGMIFMESTDQVVEALEYRGLTPMFTLNVSIGLCSLLMSWEMVLLFWRQWMKK